MFYSVQEASINEIEIKRSKFITYLFCVTTKEEIEAHLSTLRLEHKKATHVTYAYRLLTPSTEKASDDGEPSGTAGVPILDVLKKRDLNNILAVVVRYFGGIKLGAGGLVRAYAGSVVEALKKCNSIRMGYMSKYRLVCTIGEHEKLISILRNDCEQIGIMFGEEVTLDLYTNTEQNLLEQKINKKLEYLGEEVCKIE